MFLKDYNLNGNVRFYHLGPRMLSVRHFGATEARFSEGRHHRQWVAHIHRHPPHACHITSPGSSQKQWTWMNWRYDRSEAYFGPSTYTSPCTHFSSTGVAVEPLLHSAVIRTYFLDRHSFAISGLKTLNSPINVQNLSKSTLWCSSSAFDFSRRKT